MNVTKYDTATNHYRIVTGTMSEIRAYAFEFFKLYTWDEYQSSIVDEVETLDGQIKVTLSRSIERQPTCRWCFKRLDYVGQVHECDGDQML